MKLISIYRCFCDETRLRILSLLSESPLCVCHIQQVLGKSQVIISQHLAYMRERKMVSARRYQHWMVYSLPASPSRELEANLKCLQDCIQTEPLFKRDWTNLKKLMGTKSVSALLDEGCCAQPKKSRNIMRVVIKRKSDKRACYRV
jgi:ArsR family transcriptional regulator